MQGKSAEGYTISGPSWAQLLIYEQQVRRKAWASIQAGVYSTFVEALKAAWSDPCVKERYLTTPVALASAASSSKNHMKSGDLESNRAGKKARTTKGNRKGGGRGKGGGKGKGDAGKGGGKAAERLGMSSKTPDGQNLCYGYNDWNVRCKDKDCRFLHRCGKCFGNHPLYACKPGGRAETQGEGSP